MITASTSNRYAQCMFYGEIRKCEVLLMSTPPTVSNEHPQDVFMEKK